MRGCTNLTDLSTSPHMSLRDYQRQWLDDVKTEWSAGRKVVIATLGTGGGKTVAFCELVREMGQPACLIAHRSELVSQAALTLNRSAIPHGIIAQRDLVREIVALEMETHGKSFYSPSAAVKVAGVHTLANRRNDPWMASVGIVIVDEAHHLLASGLWGKALEKFPENVRVLAPTAHCRRADGKGLGRAADGLADALVLGLHSRALIERGFLSPYRIAAPPTDVAYDEIPIGASGDYSAVRLSAAVHASKTIVGDVVRTYQKFAAGKLGLTFAVDLEAAREICAAYVALGVPADVITGATSLSDRAAIMRKFRGRQLLQLVSVDVLGEGTDVPDVEVVSMARRTASWQLYGQQFGRVLRVACAPKFGAAWDTFTDDERKAHIAASDKPYGLVIDHCGNVAFHHARNGLPCSRQTYSLGRAEGRGRNAPSDAIPLRTCLNPECFQPYPRTLLVCPHCGTPAPAPAGRTLPENVDGDLVLLDPAAMAALIGEVARVDGPPPNVSGSKPPVARGILRNHAERQTAQATLREAMYLWAGWRKHLGSDQRVTQREFYFRFGVDTMTAQAYGAREAADLEQRVRAHLMENSVVPK